MDEQTIADAVRDGLEDTIQRLDAEPPKNLEEVRQVREIIMCHALCRIADALEKLVADRQETHCLKCFGTGFSRPSDDEFCDCLTGQNMKEQWRKVTEPLRCAECKGTGRTWDNDYCTCKLGTYLRRIERPPEV